MLVVIIASSSASFRRVVILTTSTSRTSCGRRRSSTVSHNRDCSNNIVGIETTIMMFQGVWLVMKDNCQDHEPTLTRAVTQIDLDK